MFLSKINIKKISLFFILLKSSIFLIEMNLAQADLTQPELNLLLGCYQEKMKNLHGQQKYDFVFSHFPDQSFYKLFIDKNRLANPRVHEKKASPHLLFDVDEPGYYNSMRTAFHFMSTTIGQEISLDLLISLHDHAISSTKTKDPYGSNRLCEMKRGLVTDGSYGLLSEKLATYGNAFEELVDSGVLAVYQLIMERLRPNYPKYRMDDILINSDIRMHFLSNYNAGIQIVFSLSSYDEEEVREKLRPYFDHYLGSISTLTTLDDKLRAIAELLRAIEIFHIFPDGNQRTIAFVTLSKLLIENNIPPAILDDPYIFDGYLTLNKMSEMINSGIYNFLREGAALNRNFLAEGCLNVHFDPQYLATRQDYIAFAKAPGRISIIDQIKLSFQNKIQNRIKIGDLNKTGFLDLVLPLTKAILFDDEPAIDVLLQHGADPAANSSEPLREAEKLGNQKVLLKLRNHLKMPNE